VRQPPSGKERISKCRERCTPRRWDFFGHTIDRTALLLPATHQHLSGFSTTSDLRHSTRGPMVAKRGQSSQCIGSLRSWATQGLGRHHLTVPTSLECVVNQPQPSEVSEPFRDLSGSVQSDGVATYVVGRNHYPADFIRPLLAPPCSVGGSDDGATTWPDAGGVGNPPTHTTCGTIRRGSDAGGPLRGPRM
jgi:hypothetical protein